MYIMYENEGRYTIEIRDIIRILIERFKLLVAALIISAVIGALASMYYISPVYESTTTLIVRQSNESTAALSQGDVNLSKSLIYTYAEIAKSNTVTYNTKKALNIDVLSSKSILISPVEDTQILKVDVQNEDPTLAMNIANTLAEQFALEVVRITSTDNVAVVDYAELPKSPIKPNILLNTVIMGMIGEMIVLFIILAVEYFDKTIKTEEDIEKYLKIPLIETIPNFSQRRKESYEYEKIYGKRTADVLDN